MLRRPFSPRTRRFVCPTRNLARLDHNNRPLSQLLQVPLIFTGLLLALWTWKSLVLIVFQHKIIFMPYLGRHTELSEFPTVAGVSWHRRDLKTNDGVTLALCQSDMTDLRRPPGLSSSKTENDTREMSQRRSRKERINVIYLQGNAGSTPPRLPHLSKILLAVKKDSTDRSNDVVQGWTVGYRGYWKSNGSPSEIGLNSDVDASLRYIFNRTLSSAQFLLPPSSSTNTTSPTTTPESEVEKEEVVVVGEEVVVEEEVVVIWGHSIGAFFAIHSLTTLFSILHHHHRRAPHQNNNVTIKLILETPFDQLSSVLRDLYPERWLPYRYLSPFLVSRFDMPHALTHLVPHDQLTCVEVLVLIAEADEIVSKETTERAVRSVAEKLGKVSVVTVKGGLHQDLIGKVETHRAVVEFISRCD